MSVDNLELVLRENPIFVGLTAKLDKFKGAVRSYEPFEELKRLAEDISRYCRHIKETYQRGDSLPQFMEVVARAFEQQNLRYLRRKRNLQLIEKKISNVITTVDLTLVLVDGFVKELEYRGIQADYL